MSVSIKNPKTLDAIYRLAKELGVGPTEAIGIAVGHALAQEREDRAADDEARIREIEALQERVDALAVLDPRPWRDLRDDLIAEEPDRGRDVPSAAA